MRRAVFLAGPVLILMTGAASAQEIDLADLGFQSELGQNILQIITTVTALSILPALLMMVTCFPFLLTVLAILRQGIGLQQSPPNMLLISIALFLTYFVMEPVFTEAWTQGVVPLNAGTIDIAEGIAQITTPFRGFMAARLDPETLIRFAEIREIPTEDLEVATAPLSIMVPAFMLTELSLAFQVGFLIYLPFLLIDLVVSAILMSMGMMMVPPSVVSLPFKLGFFVLSDGWSLVATSLVAGYS